MTRAIPRIPWTSQKAVDDGLRRLAAHALAKERLAQIFYATSAGALEGGCDWIQRATEGSMIGGICFGRWC